MHVRAVRRCTRRRGNEYRNELISNKKCHERKQVEGTPNQGGLAGTLDWVAGGPWKTQLIPWDLRVWRKQPPTRRLIQPGVLDEGKENQAGCSVLRKGVLGTGEIWGWRANLLTWDYELPQNRACVFPEPAPPVLTLISDSRPISNVWNEWTEWATAQGHRQNPLKTFFYCFAPSAFSQPSLSIQTITFYLFYAKITYHLLLWLGKLLFVIFPSEMINVGLDVHAVSLTALVTKSEIHSGGKSRSFKRAAQQVFKKQLWRVQTPALRSVYLYGALIQPVTANQEWTLIFMSPLPSSPSSLWTQNNINELLQWALLSWRMKRKRRRRQAARKLPFPPYKTWSVLPKLVSVASSVSSS